MKNIQADIGVTVSGADDNVDPVWMLQMSLRYPWLEWGILWSRKRAGSPRYPSDAWRRHLAAVFRGRCRNLSLHLCGEVARTLSFGEIGDEYGRVQINGWKPKAAIPHLGEGMKLILPTPAHVDLVRPLARRIRETGRAGNTQILWDSSGGTGNRIRLFDYVAKSRDGSAFTSLMPFGDYAPPGDVRVGFAGGLMPWEVASVIQVLITKFFPSTSFWLDMESGVRSRSGEFDMKNIEAMCQETHDVRASVTMQGEIFVTSMRKP